MSNYKPGMTAKAYCAVLERYNLTHEGAGRYFGVSKLTSIKWANDAAAIPKIMALLCELMEKHNVIVGTEYQRKPDATARAQDASMQRLLLEASLWNLPK